MQLFPPSDVNIMLVKEQLFTVKTIYNVKQSSNNYLMGARHTLGGALYLVNAEFHLTFSV